MRRARFATVALLAGLLAAPVWATTAALVIDAGLKRVTGRPDTIAVRESVTVNVIGIGGSDADDLVLYLLAAPDDTVVAMTGALSATNVNGVASASGVLDLNTTELLSVFDGAANNAVTAFTLTIWDTARARLLCHDRIPVQNNPWVPGMPDASAVDTDYEWVHELPAVTTARLVIDAGRKRITSRPDSVSIREAIRVELVGIGESSPDDILVRLVSDGDFKVMALAGPLSATNINGVAAAAGVMSLNTRELVDAFDGGASGTVLPFVVTAWDAARARLLCNDRLVVGHNPFFPGMPAPEDVDMGAEVYWHAVLYRPETFPPADHSHAMSEIDGLLAALEESVALFSGVGTTGVVTSTAGDAGKFLRADGSWDTPAAGISEADALLAVTGDSEWDSGDFNNADWNTAYGWGDWSGPVSALQARTNDWNEAHGWGDHGEEDYARLDGGESGKGGSGPQTFLGEHVFAGDSTTISNLFLSGDFDKGVLYVDTDNKLKSLGLPAVGGAEYDSLVRRRATYTNEPNLSRLRLNHIVNNEPSPYAYESRVIEQLMAAAGASETRHDGIEYVVRPIETGEGPTLDYSYRWTLRDKESGEPLLEVDSEGFGYIYESGEDPHHIVNREAMETYTAAGYASSDRVTTIEARTNDWNTAYGWGDHAGAGYLDNADAFEPAGTVAALPTNDWNAAFSWGDHAGLYRLIDWIPSWGDVTDKPLFSGAGSTGLVSSTAGDAGKFLRADGSWDTPAGEGGMDTNAVIDLIYAADSGTYYAIPYAATVTVTRANGSYQYYAPTDETTILIEDSITNVASQVTLMLDAGANTLNWGVGNVDWKPGVPTDLPTNTTATVMYWSPVGVPDWTGWLVDDGPGGGLTTNVVVDGTTMIFANGKLTGVE